MELKLLLIEDDPGFDTLIRRILEPHGPEIRSAQTIKQAAVELALHNFDVVILDLGLPDSPKPEDTIRMIPSIRTTQPDAALMVVTGSDGMKDTALAAGADVFLSKNTPALHRAFIAAIYTEMSKRMNGGRTALRESVELLGKIAEL